MEALRVEGICLDIAGARILDGVDLRVEVGERRAIIGPNGAGKTTLLSLIAGEREPTRGRVILFGEDVTGTPAHVRSRRGLVRTFQQAAVFPSLTVQENVLLACARLAGGLRGVLSLPERQPALRRQAEALLEAWGLEPWAACPARLLSYGMQRRLELAMAFAARPRVLLLDEPSAGLGAADMDELGRRLLDLPRDMTVVFVDHNMRTVFSVADRITVLHHGQRLAEGTPDEVRADPAVQAAYLGASGRRHAAAG